MDADADVYGDTDGPADSDRDSDTNGYAYSYIDGDEGIYGGEDRGRDEGSTQKYKQSGVGGRDGAGRSGIKVNAIYRSITATLSLATTETSP